MIKDLVEEKKVLLQSYELNKLLGCVNNCKEISDRLIEIDEILKNGITKLKDVNEYQVFYLHTIELYTMYAISKKMQYSERQVYRIYSNCLKKIEES